MKLFFQMSDLNHRMMVDARRRAYDRWADINDAPQSSGSFLRNMQMNKVLPYDPYKTADYYNDMYVDEWLDKTARSQSDYSDAYDYWYNKLNQEARLFAEQHNGIRPEEFDAIIESNAPDSMAAYYDYKPDDDHSPAVWKAARRHAIEDVRKNVGKVWLEGEDESEGGGYPEPYSPEDTEENDGENNGENGGESNGGSYTVKRGDSLWKIAKDHGMTVNELRELNGIQGNMIKPGQVLSVSGDYNEYNPYSDFDQRYADAYNRGLDEMEYNGKKVAVKSYDGRDTQARRIAKEMRDAEKEFDNKPARMDVQPSMSFDEAINAVAKSMQQLFGNTSKKK